MQHASKSEEGLVNIDFVPHIYKYIENVVLKMNSTDLWACKLAISEIYNTT